MFFACIFYRSAPIPFKIGGSQDYVCPERSPARLPRHCCLDIRKTDCPGERTGSGRVSRRVGSGFLIPNRSVGLSAHSVRGDRDAVRGYPGVFRYPNHNTRKSEAFFALYKFGKRNSVRVD